MSETLSHDESAVRAHFASYSRAWKANDVAALLGHWSEPDFRFYKAEETERFFTRFADVAAYFRGNAALIDIMDVEFTTLELVPCDATMVFAIVHLEWNIRFARDARLPDGSLYAHRGKAMGRENHVLALLTRTRGGWRFAGWSETPDAAISYIARLYRRNVRPGSPAAVDGLQFTQATRLGHFHPAVYAT